MSVDIYDFPIPRGTKSSMIVEIVRLANDSDLGDNGPDSEHNWSLNCRRNKYMARIGTIFFIVVIDNLEAFQFSVRQAKEMMDRYEIRQ